VKDKKAIEVQAPNEVVIDTEYINVFLAGSIEMGVAEHWQKKVIDALSDKPIRFLNPRRDDWDSTWSQDIHNDQFVEQVVWELSSLELAQIVIMYFDPNTKSPISLLELGLHAKEQKLIVLCPEGFWRKGNVDVVCEYYGINQVDTFEELIDFLKKHI
jgi:Nucleoside 2-deoxyribosyltransferase like